MISSHKKALVLGAGLSGFAATKLLIQNNVSVDLVSQGNPSSWKIPQSFSADYKSWISEKKVGVYDDLDPAVEALLRDNEVDLLVKSPGVSFTHPIVQKSQEKRIKIIGEIELGFWQKRQDKDEAPIVAITGSNGKSTTTKILGDVLTYLGKKPFVGGNIGLPFCEYFTEKENHECDMILLELSSFQLETIEKFHPQMALITNLTETHGERYNSYQEYLEAKFHIVQNMNENDHVIYFPQPELRPLKERSVSICHELNFNEEKKKRQNCVDFSLFPLPGEHNLKNLVMVLKVCELLELDLSDFNSFISYLEGLPLRCEKISTNDPHFHIYNDGKSTNWESTKVAINSLSTNWEHEETFLILGGQLRGEQKLIEEEYFSVLKKMSKIYLFGETAPHLAKILENKFSIVVIETLEKVLKQIKKDHKRGNILFSPAFPSFDQFNNYAERGFYFTEISKKIFSS